MNRAIDVRDIAACHTTENVQAQKPVWRLPRSLQSGERLASYGETERCARYFASWRFLDLDDETGPGTSLRYYSTVRKKSRRIRSLIAGSLLVADGP